MLPYRVIPWLACAILAHAGETAPQPAAEQPGETSITPTESTSRCRTAPQSWLGIDISKPEPSLSAQLPALPPGVGFLVKAVHHDSPATIAGIQEADVIWKLNEQLLVNEAQFSTLLRLHQPDQQVTLSIIRGGRSLEVPVTLGNAPKCRPEFAGELAEEALFFTDQSPMRVVNPFEREAYMTHADGRATVRKTESGYWLTIHNQDGDVIFDESFDPTDAKSDRGNRIPPSWLRRAYALRRGLDHALDGRMAPTRQPRPRVVPAPSATGSVTPSSPK